MQSININIADPSLYVAYKTQMDRTMVLSLDHIQIHHIDAEIIEYYNLRATASTASPHCIIAQVNGFKRTRKLCIGINNNTARAVSTACNTDDATAHIHIHI